LELLSIYNFTHVRRPDCSISASQSIELHKAVMSSNAEVQGNEAGNITEESAPESAETKKRPSVDKLSLKSDKDAEADDVETTEPPMTLRRFMVLLTLVWLVITSVASLSFISPVLGTIHVPLFKTYFKDI
jgi:hypothetical protein